MERRAKNVLTFGVSMALGAGIWMLSPTLTGEREAFDAFGYYLTALLVAGVVLGVSGVGSRGYGGLVLGQVLYMFVALPLGPLMPIGLIVVSFFSLLSLPGIWLGDRLRPRPGGQEPPDEAAS